MYWQTLSLNVTTSNDKLWMHQVLTRKSLHCAQIPVYSTSLISCHLDIHVNFTPPTQISTFNRQINSRTIKTLPFYLLVYIHWQKLNYLPGINHSNSTLDPWSSSELSTIFVIWTYTWNGPGAQVHPSSTLIRGATCFPSEIASYTFSMSEPGDCGFCPVNKQVPSSVLTNS